MTVPDIASAQVTVPPEGVGSRRRSGLPNGQSSRAAEADFGKQLAGVAAGEERAARPVEAREGRERPSSPLRQWGTRLAPSEPEDTTAEVVAAATAEGKECEADALLATGPTAVDASLIVPASSSIGLPPASTPAVGAPPLQPGMALDPAVAMPLADGTGPARFMALSAILDAADAANSSAPRDLAQGDLSLREVGKGAVADAMAPIQGVSVIRRETHLAASMPPALPRQLAGRVAQEPIARDAQGTDDAADVPAGNGELGVLRLAGAVARGKDSSQWPSQASSGGAAVAQAGSHSRATTAEAGSPRSASILDAAPSASADARSAAASHEAALPTPLSLPSPVQQIADKLVADIASSGEARPADGTAAVPAAATAQSLKVLTVQLNPAELGVVTVRIALKSDVLELQIEADRRETARLVDADRETLSRVLRSAGYNVETVTVRAVDPASGPAAVGSQHASPDGSPQPSQAGNSQSDARPSGGRGQAGHDGNLHRPHRDGKDEQDASRHRAGDGLYV
jgi:chemotaxis protein MotD